MSSGHDAMHVSSEVLMHFRCGHGSCQQWWSIADWESVKASWGQGFVYCPKCGRGYELKPAALKAAVGEFVA